MKEPYCTSELKTNLMSEQVKKINNGQGKNKAKRKSDNLGCSMTSEYQTPEIFHGQTPIHPMKQRKTFFYTPFTLNG